MSIKKNNTKRPLPKMPKYENQLLKKDTRSTSFQICSCYICSMARSTNHPKIVKGIGKFREFNNNIDKINEQRASRENDADNVIANKSTTITLCKNCYQSYGRGKQHACSN